MDILKPNQRWFRTLCVRNHLWV